MSSSRTAPASKRKAKRTSSTRKAPSSSSAAPPATSALEALAGRMPAGATIRRQHVKCGKPRCEKLHGPYWYAFWKQGGRTVSAYIGTDARLGELLRMREGEAAAAVDVPVDVDDDEAFAADERAKADRRKRARSGRVQSKR